MGTSKAEALLLSLTLPVLYVLPFYCYPKLAKAPRNDLCTVAFRCAAVCVSSILCVAIVHFQVGKQRDCALWEWLGLFPSMSSLLLSVVMLLCMYVPSLLDLLAKNTKLPYTSTATHICLRDLVLAPLFEEVVYRGCHCYLLLSAGFSHVTVSLVAPLFFGVSHLHHLYEAVAVRRVPLATATMQLLGQFSYTSVFGFLACLLFMHKGSLAGPLLLHSGCNLLRLPTASKALKSQMPAVHTLWLCAVGLLSWLLYRMAVELPYQASMTSCSPVL
jgi:prenyl protein peptidase